MENKNNFVIILIVAIVAIVGMVMVFSGNSKVAYVSSSDTDVSSSVGGQAWKFLPGNPCEILRDDILDKNLAMGRVKSCMNNDVCEFDFTKIEIKNLEDYKDCLINNGRAIDEAKLIIEDDISIRDFKVRLEYDIIEEKTTLSIGIPW